MRFLFFDALVTLLRQAARTFFRTIEVVGLEHVPQEGAVVFIGNHPNSLIDPMLITTHAPRRLSFAAKDTLFKHFLFRLLLRALGAVPIRRRQDHKDGATLDNSEAFEALFRVLREGAAFGIFPEGISHARSELAPLKTGAARIVLGAHADSSKVTVVPCGLTYLRRTRLRGQALIQFGEPIVIDQARLDAFEADPKRAARALTEDFELALRALTINTENFDVLRVLDAVRRLYAPRGRRLTLAERAEITRRLVDHYLRFRDDPEIVKLYGDVESYQFHLSALGLHDSDLQKPLSRFVWARKIMGHVLSLLVLIPLAVPGLIVHAPILIAAVFAGEALTARRDVIATTKFAAALGLVLVAYSAIVAGVIYIVGWPVGAYYAPLVLFGLLLSGWALIRVLERQSILRKGFSVFLLLIDLKQQMHGLVQQRTELRERTLQLIDRFIDPDLQRVVSVDEQG